MPATTTTECARAPRFPRRRRGVLTVLHLPIGVALELDAMALAGGCTRSELAALLVREGIGELPPRRATPLPLDLLAALLRAAA